MSTPSTSPYIMPARRFFIPGFAQPAGPGGGGVFYPSRARLFEESDPFSQLLPSADPLMCLRFPREAVGQTVRVFAALESLKETPMATVQVPEEGLVFVSGIYASESVPSATAGLVLVGDENFKEFQAFQLAWGLADEGRPALAQSLLPPQTSPLFVTDNPTPQVRRASCGTDPNVFLLFAAGRRFVTKMHGGEMAATDAGPGDLLSTTLYSRPIGTKALSESPVLPWAWETKMRIESGELTETSESLALTASILEVFS